LNGVVPFSPWSVRNDIGEVVIPGAANLAAPINGMSALNFLFLMLHQNKMQQRAQKFLNSLVF
jgi:hypothetical protein